MTHLLSNVIQVKGIAETKSGDIYCFSFSFEQTGHRMPVAEICEKLCFFSQILSNIDGEAMRKYNLGISK